MRLTGERYMIERKKYSKEFKLDAISLVMEQGYTRREAANSLDINPHMLGRWIQENQSEDGQAFRGNGHAGPRDQRHRRSGNPAAG